MALLPWPGDDDPVGGARAWKPAAGELLLTFHHAIADGLSAMALVQQLFALLAAGKAGPQEERQHHWDAFSPDLSRSFAGPRPPAAAVQELSDR